MGIVAVDGQVLTLGGNAVSVPEGGSVLDALINKTITSFSSDTLTTVLSYTFFGCSQLSALSLPNCITIKSHAFNGCSSLFDIYLPSLITAESYAAHRSVESSSAYSVKLPVCTTVGAYAFRNSSTYYFPTIEINLPRAENIGSNAFYGYNYVDAIVGTECDSVCTLGSKAFHKNESTLPETIAIYVPDILVASYKEASNWSEYADYIYPISAK